MPLYTGLDKCNFECKIVSYPSVLTYVLVAQKNRLIETVLLSTRNIFFGWEIRKLIFGTHSTKGQKYVDIDL